MARDFDGSTQYASADSCPVTGYPFTIACWFFADAGGSILVIGDKDTAGDFDGLQHTGTSTLWAISSAGGSSTASDGTGATLGVWHHGAGVWASATSRTAYVDGTAAITDTGSRTPAARDRTTIGARADSSLGTRFNGRVAEAGIWNVALTAAEVKGLAQGTPGHLIRPESLVGYWELLDAESPEPDLIGSVDLALAGSPPWIAHPPGIPQLARSAVLDFDYSR